MKELSSLPPFNLPALEMSTQKKWVDNNVFAACRKPNGLKWTFLEGPPTLNGEPGVHHVHARTYKDVFARYKVMQGYDLERQAGWDCHGLPVELSVMRELGLSGRDDVLAFGVEKFNNACREAVMANKVHFDKLTQRMGYWLDLDSPYMTMTNEFMVKVWEVLGECYSKGLLVKGYRVGPWCTSCRTTLSTHEVSQGYKDLNTTWVEVLLPLVGQEAALAVWTTTPWTLLENDAVGVAVNGEYVLLAGEGRQVYVGATKAKALRELGYHQVGTVLGRDLLGLRYTNPLTGSEHPVVEADHVEVESGTGLVHLASCYGEEDEQACKRAGLSRQANLGEDGAFKTGPVAGMTLRDANKWVLSNLGEAVLSTGSMLHRASTCWRCESPLVNLPRSSWFLRTSAVSAGLREAAEGVDWFPEGMNKDRYLDWLSNGGDWNLTRERFWGTPLPVWTCEQGHSNMVSSSQTLSELTGVDLAGADLHRHTLDALTFPCATCGEETRREPYVLDCWLDSGVVWYATLPEGERASLVVEGVDQTRGWFYTMQVVGEALGLGSPYERVLALGHVLDANGEKMSKSKGNVMDPFLFFDTYGADAVRWALVSAGSSHLPRKLAEKNVALAGSWLNQVWNVAAFWRVRMVECGFTPEQVSGPEESEHTLDKWLDSRVHRLQKRVSASYEAFDLLGVTRELSEFVEELSNFYVKYSRSRFEGDSLLPFLTLGKSLVELSKLLAPLVPHFAEALWEAMGGVDSVHLQSWCAPSQEMDFSGNVTLLRELLRDGVAMRSVKGVGLAQPLGELHLQLPEYEWHTLVPLLDVLKAGLNVKSVTWVPSQYAVQANWRALGARFGNQTPEVVRALPTLMDEKVAVLDVTVAGEKVSLTGDEFTLTPFGDTMDFLWELSAELLEEGEVARLARRVNEERKRLGLLAGVPAWVELTGRDAELLTRNLEVLKKRCWLSEDADASVVLK